MKWQIKPKAPKEFIDKFPEFSPLIVQLLYDRGLKTQEQIDEFFNSDYEQDIHDPFLLKDMDKAVKRTLKAIKKKEKIAVYGDYDTDGVCSSAIVYFTLKELGNVPIVYIPDRIKESHGLNKDSIKYLKEQKVNLIITVDCASRDLEEAELIKSLGMDLIITDHHQLGEKKPKALAIVNYKQNDDKYPFKELAGAGVAYKFSSALLEKAKANSDLKKWLLDLLAIATVADMMPLLGENRTVVKYGLGVLAQTQWPGIKRLMETARVSPEVTQHSVNGEPPSTNLNAYTLGFMLGPRLNAAGRIDHADIAFNLLISQDKEKIEEYVQKIEQQNTERQNLTDQIYSQLEKRIEEKYKGKLPKIIFEGDSNWKSGLIGLAASKIANKYHRPVFIYRQEDDDIHVSSRGIPQFSLIKAIEQCSEHLERFGGHHGAAGFNLKPENLEQFKGCLFKIGEEELKDEDLIPVLDIDAELSLKEISWANYDQMQDFAPFGRGNPEPRFLARGLEVTELRMVGNNGKHLKLGLRMIEKSLAKDFKAIGFNLNHWESELKTGDLVDVVFEFTLNQWNGRRDLEMKIVDLVKITE